MRPMAVSPIAMPISARRASSSGIAETAGDAGCESSVPAPHATSMKTASPTASIAYSGQCARILLPALLQELGDEARPARLVTGADAGAVVAVEVLVEQDEVAPVGIALEGLEPAVDWPAAGAVAREDPRESAR